MSVCSSPEVLDQEEPGLSGGRFQEQAPAPPGKPALLSAGWLHPRVGHTMLMLMGWLWACYLDK